MFIIYISACGYGQSALDNVAMSAEVIKDFHSIEELADYIKSHYVKFILPSKYDIDKIKVNIVRIVKRSVEGGKSKVVWEAQ